MTEYSSLSGEIELSVITSARNEANNVNEFLTRVASAFNALNIKGEIVFVDDASSDGTYEKVEEYAASNPQLPLRLIRHPFHQGIVSAIIEGGSLARGRFVCLLPSDLESLPDQDIPILYQAMDENTDVVAGWRQGRDDAKTAASKVYNFISGLLFETKVHDANWIKLIRREKLEGLVLLPDWHSMLLGLLVARQCRVKEVPTQWHGRKAGRTKFGLMRFPIALAAAVSAKAYVAFGQRPLLLFIEASAICLLVSSFSAITALILKGGNVVLVLMAATFLLLASICMSTGIAVEALRWSQIQARIKLGAGHPDSSP